MAFNGSGTFLINTSGQPVVPNTVISATAFNALTNDLANGLSTCITKDGQTTPTANIPMGNNKITGLAPGTSGTDAANLSQVQGSTAKLLQSVTGTDTITAAMVPALTAYAAGQMFYFVAAGDNTGAVTINIDSLGAKSVTRDGSVALVAGDILSGEIALVVYDGTRFQLLNGNSFTNLNVSNNLTLSGSTANGVAYLNGSKVLTSGTALVFDGTNLGIGTASPAVKLQVKSSAEAFRIEGTTARGSGNIFASFHDPTGRKGYWGYGASDDNYYIANEMNAAMLFLTNATVRATIDSSGNLGIGTTSPSAKLHVVGNTYRQNDASNSYGFTLSTTSGTTTLATLFGGSSFGIQTGGSGTNQLLLDASGQLGLGVTPSAWSAFKAFEVASAGNSLWSAGSNDLRLATNFVYNVGNKYVVDGLAAQYIQTVGQHQWYTAPSGTAGNTISFGDAKMTLTSGGQLLLGTTSTVVSGSEIAGFQGGVGLGVKSTGGDSSFAGAFWNNATTGDNVIIRFYTETAGTQRGTITYNRGGGVIAYNTTSDYRAKEVYGAVENSGEQIDALKIYRGKMKDATIERPMLIAHEAQEIVPYAVCGEKDAVDEDGKPKYQTMDHQILVPLLIAELQSLRKRVAELEAK